MIVLIDYGMGNLRSVGWALERIGGKVQITSDPKEIEKASALVLPGVGSFSQAMKNLRNMGILSSLVNGINDGKPFLGICLGLQLLFTESDEEGLHQGLDLLKGRVRRFEGDMKIPHMGWNQIKVKSQKSKIKILEGIPDGSYFYFVHSYYVEPEDKSIIVATTDYGTEFVSLIHKANIYATQFHPEKSHYTGLQVMKNFVRLQDAG